MAAKHCMSAAEVLAGNLIPTGSYPPVGKPASVWGTPKARSVSISAVAFKPASAPSKGGSQASPLDSTETVATAAGTLLGLQNENTRMSHKQVEQHRRLKAKQYFDELRCLVPGGTDSKNDRNRVLQLAIDHLKAVLSGKVSASQVVKHETAEAEEALSGEDTSGELMFEMEGVDSKKLSHNEVEQRRRMQAKMLYEELRSLLPNASKFDKNTVLLSCIHLLKQKSGVSEEALKEMVQGLNQTEAEGPSSLGSTASGGSTRAPSKTSGEAALVKALGASNKNVWGGNSASPCDVVSFADVFSGAQQQQHKRSCGRKRAAPIEEEGEDVCASTRCESSGSISSSKMEDWDDAGGRKKIRGTVVELLASGGGESETTLSSSAPSSHMSPVPSEEDEKAASVGAEGQEPRSTDAALGALALLSACAQQVSEPSTPLCTPLSGPSSCGASSLILALHPLSLASSSI
mmetsp:Transcript_70085/g.146136  ORF Transcript_70085/g.146136 Transcript_70085/m.146136 type:complete len:462 (-) Transcript_70085:21-1406(-)